jgi:hypothetical protein
VSSDGEMRSLHWDCDGDDRPVPLEPLLPKREDRSALANLELA